MLIFKNVGMGLAPLEIARHGASSGRARFLMGFTLTEVILAVAILILIFGLTVGIGSNFYASEALISERDNLLALLRSARGMALNNEYQTNHGVYIATSSYVIFNGASYAARNQDFDVVFPRSGGVTLSGFTEIVFSTPDGGSNVSGTIIFSNGLGTSTISLNYEGRINW